MRMQWLVLCSALLLAAWQPAVGQSLDAAVSLGSVATSNFSGGAWPGVSVTGMFSPHFGANAEFAARTGIKQTPLQPPPGYRQYLLDINAVYRPRTPGARFQPELLVGGGALFDHNSELFACAAGCTTPPTTIRTKALHLAAGFTALATAHTFVRFTAHFYITGPFQPPVLFQAAIGYTFGGAR